MKRFATAKTLASLVLLILGTATAHAMTLNVACGARSGLTSIGAALRALEEESGGGSNTVNVSGICHENVLIRGFDQLTLNGLKGAQIVDASNQTADTLIITQSQNVIVQGFSVHGGYDAIDIYGNASVRLVNIVSQGALYDGVGVYRNASVVIVNSALQNNGYAGVLVVGGDVTLTGGTLEYNYEGIAVDNGARAYIRVSDPFYDGVPLSNAALISNNQDYGVFVQRGGFQCASCTISGNSSGGVFAEFSGTVKLSSYSSATLASAPPTTVTANGGRGGIVVGALTSVTLASQTTVTGNAGAYQITCDTPISVTRGAAAAAGGPGGTNCTDY